MSISTRTSEFLTVFRQPLEPLHLRAFKPKKQADKPENCPLLWDTNLAELTSNRELQKVVKAANQTRGIYFCPNVGGATDESIKRFTAFFAEDDSRSITEQHSRLDSAPLPPSIRVETRNSVHAYWLIGGDCGEAEWRDVQARLIAHFDGDPNIKNPARVMRLPGFDHLHFNGKGIERRRVVVHTFDPERRYTVAEMVEAFAVDDDPGIQAPSTSYEFHEDRHAELCQRIMARGKRNARGNWDASALCHNGAGKKGLVYFPATSAVKCNAKCEYSSILRAEGLPDGRLPSRNNYSVNPVCSEKENGEPIPWPELDPAALYGITGDFVRLVGPHTESDPVALLVQHLSAFGSVIGRGPHFKIEADTHFLNIFSVEVGETGTGRKGTSWGQVRRRFEAVDEEWNRECVVSGLSSGEGLLYHVRDPIVKIKKNRKTGIEEEVIVDYGVTDKRLFIHEGELGGALQASSRDGNTLSATIRNLWDSGTHRSLVKNSPIKTTDAHVSINGHIVRYELLQLLGDCESFNGFANRFLWICVRRSRFLPRGGRSSNLNFTALTLRLKEAIRFASKVGEMTLDDEAWALWDSVYIRLETGRAGLLGKVTQRASPYTLRLACLYALLDRSAVVSKSHLLAALALWQYAEDSARYIFGARTGDKLADDVLDALRAAGSAGMSLTELNDYFHGNQKSDAINRALQLLSQTGQAREQIDDRTGKAGRPTTRWFFFSKLTEKTEEPPIQLSADNYSVSSVTSKQEKDEAVVTIIESIRAEGRGYEHSLLRPGASDEELDAYLQRWLAEQDEGEEIVGLA